MREGGLKVVMCSCEGSDPASGWGGFPHRQYGVFAWTAQQRRSVALLYVDPTRRGSCGCWSEDWRFGAGECEGERDLDFHGRHLPKGNRVCVCRGVSTMCSGYSNKGCEGMVTELEGRDSMGHPNMQ